MAANPTLQSETRPAQVASKTVAPELREAFFSAITLPEDLHRHIRGNPVSDLVRTPDGDAVKLEQMSTFLWEACVSDFACGSEVSAFDWNLENIQLSVYGSVSRILTALRRVWNEYEEDEELSLMRLRSYGQELTQGIEDNPVYGPIVERYIQMILLTEDKCDPSSYDLNRKYHPFSVLPILLEYYLVKYIERHFPGDADLSSPFQDRNGIDVHFSLASREAELPVDVKYGLWGVKVGRNGTHLKARRRSGYSVPDEDFPSHVVYIMMGKTRDSPLVGEYCGSVGKVLGDALLAMKGTPVPLCTRMHECLSRAVAMTKGVKFQ